MIAYAGLPHPCGTVSGWRHGCRCAECRAVHAAEVARYRANRASRSGAEVHDPPTPAVVGLAPELPPATAPALAAGTPSAPASTAPASLGGTLALAVVALILILGVIAVALRRGGQGPPPAPPDPPWRPKW